MAQRYVPPALRKSLSSVDDADKPSHPSSKRSCFTRREIESHYDPLVGSSGTLNARATAPNELAFIFVYKGAHPTYPPYIFCKSNLHLLPEFPGISSASTIPTELATSDDSKAEPAETPRPTKTETKDTEPVVKPAGITSTSIPVFTNVGETVRNNDFVFAGFHLVGKTTRLAAGSEELIDMLQQKWTLKDDTDEKSEQKSRQKKRNPADWKRTLDMDWAVVELIPDPARAGDPCPVVPKPVPTVQETLEKLRLRDADNADPTKSSGASHPPSPPREASTGVEEVTGEST
ncbi:MAG: hypothetical protein M1825_001253 [Sarcosagium campestre]|nr:MAG: hypothetical protein M1825_001253 [Sarcosagium campestre]